MNKTNTLVLFLKKEWYRMIECGEKPEEYREFKPYWIKRLMKCINWCGVGVNFKENNDVKYLERKCCCEYQCENVDNMEHIMKQYTHVRFHYGYTKKSMIFSISSIALGIGNPLWGAPSDKKVFIIKLRKKLE